MYNGVWSRQVYVKVGSREEDHDTYPEISVGKARLRDCFRQTKVAEFDAVVVVEEHYGRTPNGGTGDG